MIFHVGKSDVDVMASLVKHQIEILSKMMFSLDVVFSYDCKALRIFLCQKQNQKQKYKRNAFSLIRFSISCNVILR